MQHRILIEGPLHQTNGQLSETGYATSLMKSYDRKRIKAPKWRIKEWDYYLITSEDYALALTIADNAYMGMDSVSLIDFQNKRQITKSAMSLMPLGKRGLPNSSVSGASRAVGKNYEINFVVTPEKRDIYGHFYDFSGEGSQLLFDLTLQNPVTDSMVIVTPFENKPYHFYYNQKINCLPASGHVILDKEDFYFSPSTAFGVLDWGRGVWPYKNTWYWGSLSGVVMGRPFGLNIGHGFGDTSLATENMVIYAGRAHKLGQVHFSVPQKDGREDYLSPWQIYDDSNRLKMVFEPILDRYANINALLLASVQHQVFGRFSGEVVLDSGETLNIENMIGFLEKVYNKW
ncbi:MAG: DUF2804 domain-containing protein [Bacillota bacterium]|nr:DUF2804 domain-containing protein [Bacillota bacterium]